MESNNNDKTQKNDDTDWKIKFNDLLNTCQQELKKTTQIGMKMLSASQSNAKLHETYEALGMWLKQAVESGDIKIDDADVENLLAQANKLESELENFEEEVQTIKKNK